MAILCGENRNSWEEPLLSNPNYLHWRLLVNLTGLATGSRPDRPLNSDINSPHIRTPTAIAKQNFLYGISSPHTDTEDDVLSRSRSDLTGTSSLVDESSEERQQISLMRNASPINGEARAQRSESIAINVDDDEKTPILNKRRRLPRSSSAPAMVALSGVPATAAAMAKPQLSSASTIVRQAVIGVVVYLAIGVGIFVWKQKEFTGHRTSPVVDGLYFCIVTMCTIGYGDIVPNSTWTKVFICFFILVGFGFIDILLSGLVTYMLDKQETVLLLNAADHGSRYEAAKTYIIDVEKGRMRIRIKVALALLVVGACIGVGTLAVRSLERLSWLDSFYVTVTSVTTLGYGDYAFETLEGRLFASVWLLVSTLAVARAFLYLTELRIDRRNRAIAKWVLHREMTLGDLVAADIDNNGSVSKSEYVIYKLKEMGKVEEKDIVAIVKQFNRLDTDNCGKITLSLLSGH